MIKGEKATFKCPLCDRVFVGNSAEIAVLSWEHYKKEHEEKHKD